MFTFIDNQLNKVTMHRMTVYSLIFILAGAVLLGSFKLIPQNPFAIVFSLAFFLFVCDVINGIFARTYGAKPNMNSIVITALILAAIISPPTAVGDVSYYTLAFWASVWAMASKYMFAIKRKHVLNPAAVAVAITSLFLGLSATWWVATPKMLPFVAIGGFLLVRKIRRGNLVWSFFVTAVLSVLAPTILSGGNIISSFWHLLAYSPLVFFACIMLTEPISTPPRQNLRILYGAFVGLLFAPWVHIGSFYGTPELALLAGNVIFYILSAVLYPPYKAPVPVSSTPIVSA